MIRYWYCDVICFLSISNFEIFDRSLLLYMDLLVFLFVLQRRVYAWQRNPIRKLACFVSHVGQRASSRSQLKSSGIDVCIPLVWTHIAYHSQKIPDFRVSLSSSLPEGLFPIFVLFLGHKDLKSWCFLDAFSNELTLNDLLNSRIW